jgi:cytochrome c554/c'-like protein
MRKRIFPRNLVLAISLIGLSVAFFSRCIHEQSKVKETTTQIHYEDFAGSESCRNCHKTIFQSHLSTPHFFASHAATAEAIKGSFAQGENGFSFTPRIAVKMEKKSDSFYQTAYLDGIERISKRFDIVFGSGTKGQTYSYWNSNKLFQLPITYFTQTSQWCNSPGYPGAPKFNRPITSRCLECHSTFFQKISADSIEPEEFDRNKILYGVTCERCHGPGARHVKYHTENPRDTIARFIINTAKLSRQQNLDLCILCHGGRLQKLKPSFSFKAGDRLSNYFKMDTGRKYVPSIDVHGNQFGLLASSKCFIRSEMTCLSCHSPHDKERGNNVLFSQRCMSCHSQTHANFCTVKVDKGIDIEANCIDCHMPKQRSMAIAVLLPGDEVPTAALLRSHFISIYPGETEKFLEQAKKKKNNLKREND